MSMNTVFPTVLTGTITGCRVSNVTSYYFLDNLPAEVLQFAGSGDQLRIYDGAKWKVVTLGAKGTGETLSGVELITNGTFASNTNGWTPVGCTLNSVAGGDAGNCLEITRTGGTTQTAYVTVFSATLGRLYRRDVKIKDGSIASQNAIVHAYRAVSPFTGLISLANLISTSAWVLSTGYGTCVETAADYSLYLRKNNSSEGTLLFDTASLQQVLTPSTSGLWYTPVSEETGWSPNAATHTYRLLARRIASGAGGYLK